MKQIAHFSVVCTLTAPLRVRATNCQLWFSTSRLRQDQNFDSAGGIRSSIYAFGGWFEILGPRMRDISEGLRIAVYEREPGALDLHHDAVSFTKRVVEIGHFEIDLGHFAGHERLRLLPGVAKFGAHGFAPQELLITAHVKRRLTQDALVAGAGFGRVGEVFGIDVDELYDKIGIRAGGRDFEF